jgi:outer membrane lipoprotein SlyB
MAASRFSTSVALGALVLVTACAAPQRRDEVVYVPAANAPSTRPVPVYAEYGRVENIGMVRTEARASGAGAVLGAVIGGVLGNQIGGGTGRALSTGAGAIGGAVAGNAIEGRTLRDGEVYHVQVRFDNGTYREFDFQRIDDLRTGDRVKLENGQLHRL